MEKSKTEKLYDEKIAPLLKKACDMCADNGVPFLALAEYNSDEIGETSFQTNDECLRMVMTRHCFKTSPNIDGYFIGLIRYAKKHNIDMGESIVVRLLNLDND